MAETLKDLLKEPQKQEYATKLTLIGIFLAIFTAFSSRMPMKTNHHRDFELKPFDLLLLGLATFRLGRLVAYDRVAEPIREPFTETVPDETGAGETVEPKGRGVRQSIGQLLSCPICAGTWVASALVYGLHMLPNPTRVFMAIQGATGMVEVLNALTEALSWTGQFARRESGEK
jgi:hypothetical protein